MRYQFTRVSSNAKTGPIPTTMTERESCPDTCPLKGSGCYGENFPLSLHWSKVADTGISAQDLADKLIALPILQLWRHNVAGDLPTIDGVNIDPLELLPILKAVKSRKLKTILYTHHNIESNLYQLELIKSYGVNVNASCENVDQAKFALDHGINAVMVVPIGSPKTERVGDIKMVACPAQYRDNVTCASCGLCAMDRTEKRAVITFEAHGAKKKHAIKAIEG